LVGLDFLWGYGRVENTKKRRQTVKRTKEITYDSCDLCDSEEKAKGQCDICEKYLCSNHHNFYPWGDQMYEFCPKHYELVSSIIKETEIPIGFVVNKLTNKMTPSLEKQFIERGYDKLWKEEWLKQI